MYVLYLCMILVALVYLSVCVCNVKSDFLETFYLATLFLTAHAVFVPCVTVKKVPFDQCLIG